MGLAPTIFDRGNRYLVSRSANDLDQKPTKLLDMAKYPDEHILRDILARISSLAPVSLKHGWEKGGGLVLTPKLAILLESKCMSNCGLSIVFKVLRPHKRSINEAQ